MQPPTRNLAVRYDRLERVLVTKAKISKAFDPRNVRGKPPTWEFDAIWDTGASGTCISPRVAECLGLTPTGMGIVHTGGGSMMVPKYVVNLVLGKDVGFAGLPVLGGRALAGGDILIGMDVIGLGDFAVTNFEGKTTLSFRVPSAEVIDFTA